MTEWIHPKAEPFLFQGDEIGCLLIHGLTGSPANMRVLGEHLAGEGRTVLGPRLFGHGTAIKDLDRARYEDWLASVEDGYHMLRRNTERQFIIGLSMGAALSLILASRFKVDGVAALSTAYRLPDDPRVTFAHPLSLVWRRVDKRKSDWRDPKRRQQHFSYPQHSAPAVAELIDLLAEMRASLPQVYSPVLLIQSRQDGSRAVPANAMPAIAGSVGSHDVETHWLENSGHVITLDAEREQVFARVSQFIHRVLDDLEHKSNSKAG